jgi:mRNA interferase RelE/StbE
VVSWEVVWEKRAADALRRLDATTARRIGQAVTRLAELEQGDVKRLHGREQEWRLRVGDWRVRFRYETPTHTMIILRVLPRGRAYRD